MKLIGIILALIVALIPASTSAQPLVAAFFGTVQVEGINVPDGVKVSAWVEGKKVAETTTKNSQYFLTIPEPSGRSFADKKVSFQVGGYPPEESGIWKAGEVFKLDLNVVIKTPTVAFFKGSVRVNNDTVIDGTKVEAWIEGEMVASDVTTGSSYFLKVEQPKGKFFEGKPISFKVMGLDANPSAIWKGGTEITLNLVAYTQPSLPCLFNGSVRLEGGDVPDGTVISAWLEGQKLGEANTLNSRYALRTIQPSNKNYQGKQVNFKIGELWAEQTGTWQANSTIDLNLTAKFSALVSLQPLLKNIYPGRLFTVEINIDPRGRGLSSAELEVAFNPEAMEISKTTAGDILGAKPLRSEKMEEGRLIYALARAGITSPPTPPSTFALIQFKVKEGSQIGGYPITIIRVSLSDEKFIPISNIKLSSTSIQVIASITGDINGDGKVGYQDLALLGVTYGKSRGQEGFKAEADLNDDGIIDYKDLGILGANYGLER